MKLNNRSGFSLVEVIVTAMLLTIAVISILFSILGLKDMAELSNEKMIAVMDANRILEQMRDTANTSLTTLRNQNWTAWAQANVFNPKAGNGEFALDQEAATVTFLNAGNPAQFTLTVTWQSRGHQYLHQITTSMTNRSST